MKVLVAGASGLIGREVVRLLVEAGHGVRTLSQNAERAERLRALTGDVRLADATKEDAIRGVCQGIDVVVSALGAPVLPGAGTARSPRGRSSCSRAGRSGPPPGPEAGRR